MEERELLGIKKPSEYSDEGYIVIRIKKKYFIIGIILIVLIIVFMWGFVNSSSKNPSSSQVPSSISSQPAVSSVAIPSPQATYAPPTNTKPKKNGNTFYGTVVSFGGNGFTMQTRQASWTVTVTLSTVITGAKGAPLQLSQIYVNDRVKVSGVINNATKTVSATTVKDTGPKPLTTPVVPTPTPGQ